MAYNVTWVLTRPNAETALPTIESISSSNKVASDTALADAGITKGYEVDGLVTRVIYTAPDKETFDTRNAWAVDSLVDEQTVRTTYKSQLQAAGITCVITDSDGTEIANF